MLLTGESDSFSCLFKEKHRDETPTGDFPSRETLSLFSANEAVAVRGRLGRRAGRFVTSCKGGER